MYSPLNKSFHFGIGDGSTTTQDLVSLDVVGHEISHGVTHHSADFVYLYESGALDESFADIFGTMVEYYGLSGAGDYMIGEDFWIADGKLRDMQNPTSKQHPDTYLATNNYWHTGPSDFGGVHTNSGVQNRWFYLLSEGGSGINALGFAYEVEGIGRANAAAIAYHSLNNYLMSFSNYSDAKNGAIWSAGDLFGFCSWEMIQTIRAWDAVGVPSSFGFGDIVTANCTEVNHHRNMGWSYTERAISTLYSDCQINSGTESLIEFAAGESISLLPGFESSSNFMAYIDPCFSNIQFKSLPIGGDELIYSTGSEEVVEVTPRLLNFKCFPNPTHGQVTLDFSQSMFLLTEPTPIYTLYSSTGDLLESSACQMPLCTIDLTARPAGIYLLGVQMGHIFESTRVVKQ
jgi:hypothetical protein